MTRFSWFYIRMARSVQLPSSVQIEEDPSTLCAFTNFGFVHAQDNVPTPEKRIPNVSSE